MLRASVDQQQSVVRLETVMGDDGETGIGDGDLLIGFAEAVVARSPAAITSARQQLMEKLGVEATVDAAGVVSNFQRMVRIADSTGIGLGRFQSLTRDFREQLGIEDFRHK